MMTARLPRVEGVPVPFFGAASAYERKGIRQWILL